MFLLSLMKSIYKCQLSRSLRGAEHKTLVSVQLHTGLHFRCVVVVRFGGNTTEMVESSSTTKT